MTLSLRARLTVWYTFALLIVMVLGAAAILWQQGRIGLRRVDRGLADLTTTIVNLVRDELNEDPVLSSAARKVRETVAAPGRAVAILDSQGQPLAAAWNGLALQPPLPDFQGGLRVWTAETSAGAWRVRAEPAAFGIQTVVVVDATPLSDVLRERREVQEAMWVGIPGILVLAAAGGLWLASIGLRPITAMAERAANMPLSGVQNLGEFERTDELGQLARAFNGLVARLRAALQTQRQFMADASHELRTPVSIIRTAADVTLRREHRDEAEYREALAMAGAQSRRLGTLVEDMLVLARADAGAYPLRPVELYLDDVVEQCRRAVDVLAAERGITVISTGVTDVSVRGDEELLRRLMVNLLQNAVQHSPHGGAVSVDISPNGSRVCVRVVDSGAGIPEADQSRIFDRFVQLDPSRRAEGTGLGLTIAKWIADVHQGSLSLESSGPAGSTFCVILPVSH